MTETMDDTALLAQLNAALQAFAGDDAARAEALCTGVLAHSPNRPEALTLLGILRRRTGLLNEAEDFYRKALTAEPRYADAHHNLGNLLLDRGQPEQALSCFEAAVRLRNDWPEGLNRVGATLHALGRLEEAYTWFERALALRPDSADIHWDYALALLAGRRFTEGWREYEWRWRRGQPAPRVFAQPAWQGESLADRTILVYVEQGYGDALQFLRFLPRLRARGARVVLEIHSPLAPLIDAALGADEVVVTGSELPAFDCHVSLLSLPFHLRIGIDDLAGNTPYLRVPPVRAARWRGRIAAGRLRVGLVWAGNPGVKNDRWRSPRFAPLLPLLSVPGVQFYALQKGDGERDTEGHCSAALTPLGPEIHDFADTAAILAELDLLITTDTSVAHLAGALGCQTWVLLHGSPDWRWGPSGETTPWYGSLRLFRQQSFGDWSQPVAEIARLLRECAGGVAHPALQETVDACPLCGSRASTLIGTFDCRQHALWHSPLPANMRWLRCEVCTHIYSAARYTQAGLEELFRRAHPTQLGGGDFDAQRFVWSRVVERVLAHHTRSAELFRGNLTWLDVGCGAGGLVFTAAEYGFSASGLDAREEAARRLTALGYAAQVGDLMDLPGNARYSVISLADVLEHLADPRGALHRIHSLLEDDGLVFISCPNVECAAWRGLDAAGANPYWQEIEHLHNFSRSRLTALLLECGFDPCSYGVSQRYKACMEIIARRTTPPFTKGTTT